MPTYTEIGDSREHKSRTSSNKTTGRLHVGDLKSRSNETHTPLAEGLAKPIAVSVSQGLSQSVCGAISSEGTAVRENQASSHHSGGKPQDRLGRDGAQIDPVSRIEETQRSPNQLSLPEVPKGLPLDHFGYLGNRAPPTRGGAGRGVRDLDPLPAYLRPASVSTNSMRTMRVRQSLRTDYASRLQALEAAEEEQRLRLAAPYRRRLLQKASCSECFCSEQSDAGHNGSCPFHSTAESSGRRRSKLSSNPYENPYYVLFQSDEKDEEIRAKALGVPPKMISEYTRHRSAERRPSPHATRDTLDNSAISADGRKHGNTDGVATPFTSTVESHLATAYIAKLPQWKQKRLSQSRHLLKTLHPVAATTYVKYEKVYEKMLEEDRLFEKERKAFFDRSRRALSTSGAGAAAE